MTWENIAASFIKSFESCSLKAYHGAKDRPGLYSCGWGSTGADVDGRTVWTQEEADARFLVDLRKFGAGVDSAVMVPLNDNEKAACVSFAYNCGLHNFESSLLLKKLNDDDRIGASAQFHRWDMSNGMHVAGLMRRRKAEAELFLGGS